MNKQTIGTLPQATHTPIPELKIFKTIRRGRCKSAEAYRQAIVTDGCRIGIDVDKILDEMPVSKIEVEVDLGVVTGTGLGFKKPALRVEIYRRIFEIGAELCLSEDGPALRLVYQNQQANGRLTMAMRAIFVSGSGLKVFGIDSSRFSVRWLISRYADSSILWRPDHHWIVVVPRK